MRMTSTTLLQKFIDETASKWSRLEKGTQGRSAYDKACKAVKSHRPQTVSAVLAEVVSLARSGCNLPGNEGLRLLCDVYDSNLNR